MAVYGRRRRPWRGDRLPLAWSLQSVALCFFTVDQPREDESSRISASRPQGDSLPRGAGGFKHPLQEPSRDVHPSPVVYG